MPFSEAIRKDSLTKGQELAELAKGGRAYLRSLPSFFREALDEVKVRKTSEAQKGIVEQLGDSNDNGVPLAPVEEDVPNISAK